MKVTQFHLRIVIVLMGLGLIGLALTKKFFDFPNDPVTLKNIGSFLFVGAAVLLVWNRKLYNDRLAEEKKKKEEENQPPETKE